MKTFNQILFLSFSLSLLTFAQVSPSLSNFLRYGNGEQSLGATNNDFEYFENLTDLRLSVYDNFNFGLRFLYDSPPEIGENFEGIKRRFIEYNSQKLKLRVGNSSELYGRGLVLNLFENRGLAYDTWLDGIKANYKNDNISASIIAGRIDFRDSVTVTRFETHDIRGGNVELSLFQNLILGSSFISANSKLPQLDKSNLYVKSELPEIYLDYYHDEFSFYFNYAHKWSYDNKNRKAYSGQGFYSSFSYADENFGLTLEYKNYLFDEQDPFLQNDVTRASKFLSFQNAPIVMKEHSYIFLSRSLHMVDFNDEVGFQIDLNLPLTSKLSFNLNYSLASRHNNYVYSSEDFRFEKVKRNSNYLPSSEKEYSPYSDFFIEGEYFLSSYTNFRFGFAQREKTIYNYFTGIAGSHTIKSSVFPFLAQHTFSKNLSLIIQYELESVTDNYNSEQPNFSNHYFSILASLFRKVSVAFRYERTTDDFDTSGRKDWFVSELGYRITGSNLLTVSYGRERGGQVCTNGICQYLLPFKGLRLTIQTNL